MHILQIRRVACQDCNVIYLKIDAFTHLTNTDILRAISLYVNFVYVNFVLVRCKGPAHVLEITTITSEFAVAPQISLKHFQAIRDRGFRSILNARPDDEDGDYLTSGAAGHEAGIHDLGYAHVPTNNHAIFETANIDLFEQALVALPKPVLAHCKSGTRAVILWAMVAARHRDTEDVIALLTKSGHDLAFLEQELIDQSAQATSTPLRLKNNGLLNLGRSPLLGSKK